MPSSAFEGKNFIKKIINNMIDNKEFRILDLGCGKGTYAKLIQKPCYKVAVDAIDYREKFNLMDFYDEFHQQDIRNLGFKNLGHFDLAIAGDVLEHMSVEDAQKVLRSMEEISDSVIVAVPFTYPQKGRGGNHWEDHIQDDLTTINMKERYPSLVPIAIYNKSKPPWNGGEYYGYYIWIKSLEERNVLWQDQELK